MSTTKRPGDLYGPDQRRSRAELNEHVWEIVVEAGADADSSSKCSTHATAMATAGSATVNGAFRNTAANTRSTGWNVSKSRLPRAGYIPLLFCLRDQA